MLDHSILVRLVSWKRGEILVISTSLPLCPHTQKMLCEPKSGSRKCQSKRKSTCKLKSFRCLLYIYKINIIYIALIEVRCPNARNCTSKCFNMGVWLIFLNINSFLEANFYHTFTFMVIAMGATKS